MTPLLRNLIAMAGFSEFVTPSRCWPDVEKRRITSSAPVLKMPVYPRLLTTDLKGTNLAFVTTPCWCKYFCLMFLLPSVTSGIISSPKPIFSCSLDKLVSLSSLVLLAVFVNFLNDLLGFYKKFFQILFQSWHLTFFTFVSWLQSMSIFVPWSSFWNSREFIIRWKFLFYSEPLATLSTPRGVISVIIAGSVSHFTRRAGTQSQS